jgi:hypothetical protein
MMAGFGRTDPRAAVTGAWGPCSYGPAIVTVNGVGQHRVDAVMTGIINVMTR